MNWNLHIHDHLNPWTDADCTVVDAYRLYGQTVTMTSESGWTVTGRLVQMTDQRWATVEADGKCYAMRPMRIEVVK